MLPVPQCYYVPGRIRECHRSRLEAAGLWILPEAEKQEKKTFRETFKSKKEKTDTHVYLQAFQREKVCNLHFRAMSIYHIVSGFGESSCLNGYLHPPSWL
jgi:sorting and assembly machinery component 37